MVSRAKILFSILSNYATESLVKVNCEIPVERLSKGNNGQEVAEKSKQRHAFLKLIPTVQPHIIKAL